MKNTLKIDFENSHIVMDREFAKRCENTTSPEYRHLQSVRQDYPEFRVVRKTIRRNENKECYKGLTYAYMERYIAAHDKCGVFMAEYNQKREIAECHSIRYPVIKEWFLETFPEVKMFGVREAVMSDEVNGRDFAADNMQIPAAS